MDSYNVLATIMKVFGHPARLEILYVLSRGEACVCHLEAVLGYRQAYISQHLMKLREVGLVTDRRDDMYVFYSLVDESVHDLLASIHGTAQTLTGERITLETQASTSCNCPSCQPDLITIQESD